MIDLTTIIISACTGSLAATFVNYGYAWWYQPNLEVDASAEGCIVRNFPQSNNRSKKFLRLRIFNAGRTTAKNVQIVIPKIYMVTTPKSVIQGEVFDAKWSSFEALQISIP